MDDKKETLDAVGKRLRATLGILDEPDLGEEWPDNDRARAALTLKKWRLRAGLGQRQLLPIHVKHPEHAGVEYAKDALLKLLRASADGGTDDEAGAAVARLAAYVLELEMAAVELSLVYRKSDEYSEELAERIERLAMTAHERAADPDE